MIAKSASAAMAVAVVTLTGAQAQDDIIALRQRLMDVNAAAATLTGDMVTGVVPFDPAIARAALMPISHNLEVFPSLFPAGSDTGETLAQPAIWTDMDGFKAAAAQLSSDASAAANTVSTLDDLAAALVSTISIDCANCHAKYRRR